MKNMGYGQPEQLKDIVEKEAEEEEQPAAVKEEEEQQQVPAAKEQRDDEWYDTVVKRKFVNDGNCVKEFRVTANLSNSNTRMIMANITPHIEMRVKVIYSFK